MTEFQPVQPYALTVDKFLDHAARWHGEVEVVSEDGASTPSRRGYAAVQDRSRRLSGALARLGLAPGERLATLAWNTAHHLEVWYAVMGAGSVCHTLNPRLPVATLARMVEEAQDKVLAVSVDLAPLAAELLTLSPGLRRVILMDQEGAASQFGDVSGVECWEFEALLRDLGEPLTWGDFDETTPAGLCYTSGTTGAPKGVVYTHRSNFLHTMRTLQADALALTDLETVMVAVPMFHANGWGLPFSAPAAGSRLVLPGRKLDGASLATLMRREAVTMTAGVPTVWLGLLDHLDREGGELPDLKRVLVGGASCPPVLIQRIEDRLGVTVQTSWGMTELSPMGTISSPHPTPGAPRASGRIPFGMDARLVDEAGAPLARDPEVVGRLQVKGPSVLQTYLGASEAAVDADGFFPTGDLARIDDRGALTITGRSKDLIKSGGEWINPSEIEEIIGQSPQVALAAVIGREDAKWGERPILIVEARPGGVIDPAELLGRLAGRIATWWVPDEVVVVSAMPLAPTGKIDKVRLRADHANALR